MSASVDDPFAHAEIGGRRQRPPAETPEENPRKAARVGVHGSSGSRSEALGDLEGRLLRLGSAGAKRDEAQIHELAKRVVAEHLPKVGARAVISLMRDVFLRPSLSRSHRLLILYVFNDLRHYVPSERRAAIAQAGAHYFLEEIGCPIAKLGASKTAAFMRLLDLWGSDRIYPASFLTRLRQLWSSPAAASATVTAGGAPG